MSLGTQENYLLPLTNNSDYLNKRIDDHFEKPIAIVNLDPSQQNQNYITRSKSKSNGVPKTDVKLDTSFIGLQGAGVIHEMLRRNNVEYVFGYNGGAIIRVLDVVCHSQHMKVVYPRHEQGAGFMAEGYARSTGKPGVLMVTSGPGATNLITPLADAFFDGVPLVAFTGQVSKSALGTDSFQEVDITGMTRSCTKWSVMVKNVNDIPSVINKAFHIAISGRPGPVLIDLPVDVTSAMVTEPIPLLEPISAYSKSVTFNYEQKDHLANISKSAMMINHSKKPVIYVGQGILNHPEGPKLLSALANNGNIPVTTTFHALGAFDEEDPKSLNMMGDHGTCFANLAIQNADVIIALGARFDNRAIGPCDKFAPVAIKSSRENCGGIIHFDILPQNISKVVKADIAIEGDVTENLKKLLPQIERRERREWFDTIYQWKKQYPFYYEEAINDDQVLNAQQVIKEFDHQIKDKKDKVTVTTGVGNHQLWAANVITWKYPHTFISSGGFGAMGYGLPSAIGVKLANPNRIVVDIDGDSSFSMTAMELATAAEFNIGVKVIIINNSSQNMITEWQDKVYQGRHSCSETKNPDFCMLAKSMGVKCIHVSKASEIESKMDEFLNYDGPVVMNVITGKNEHFYPTVKMGQGLDDFILHPVIAKRNRRE